jgi:hypothetical protein
MLQTPFSVFVCANTIGLAATRIVRVRRLSRVDDLWWFVEVQRPLDSFNSDRNYKGIDSLHRQKGHTA